MCNTGPTLEIFEKNLVDLNNDYIPKHIMDKFWEIKEEKGSTPMGISHILGVGWYILCPSDVDGPVLKCFSEEK